jgi:sec-independent protein translocase protein TatA
MLDISPVQILIVLVIALLVFGPKRLPEMGKSIGRGIREFKGAILDDEPRRPAESPAKGAPAAAVPAAPGPVADADADEVAPEADDEILEGVVLSGDTPPKNPDS